MGEFIFISTLFEDPHSPEGERRDGKINQFCGFANSVLSLNKAAGLAVSVCGATVRPERGLASEAGATLAQLLCQEEAESPELRGLGIPRCHASAASGGCQTITVFC
ncbi:MAG: hypothetical protein F6K48_28675 [Okeania sp. SIO3H1]|uniref:hypothetical protein n=1 Tax=Okeania sp. SIO1I7 TaxID=2607772 RepID=UPI0013C5A672|nr:hypothetical protein [Okeania sp. SIO1I7]NEN92660.1 hypothetical protein [Okeania sp. SIO3H1]NET27168.1 hypothetical protein [Okeania sp. SIO1I7]